MTIRDEKVRPQLGHVQMDLSDSMGTINHAQNPLLPTNSHKSFERESNTGIANNRIEDSSPNFESLFASFPNHLTEPTLKFILNNGVLESNFPSLKRAVFLERDDALLHGSINRLEVNQGFPGLEIQVIQDGCNTGGGVLDKDTFVLRCIEKLRDICTRLL